MVLIYTNNFSGELSISAELFADDSSLFSDIHDSQASTNDFNKNLEFTLTIFLIENEF